jgi:hypothetical protein
VLSIAQPESPEAGGAAARELEMGREQRSSHQVRGVETECEPSNKQDTGVEEGRHSTSHSMAYFSYASTLTLKGMKLGQILKRIPNLRQRPLKLREVESSTTLGYG